MNIKERNIAVLRRETPDMIPWLVYDGLFPGETIEEKLSGKIFGLDVKKLIDIGMGLEFSTSLSKTRIPKVTIKTELKSNTRYRTYRTTSGSISMKEKRTSPGGWWVTEYPIKKSLDCDVMTLILEDEIIEPAYEEFRRTEKDLESYGIVRGKVSRSPFQKLLIELMGNYNVFVYYHKNRNRFDELIRVLRRKCEEEYKIAAESPAEVIIAFENITSLLTNPVLFEEYCLPFYNEMADLLHRNGKIYQIHMDGLLYNLKSMIEKLKADVIEAFTPPPIGDLSLSEARLLWKDKILAVNFPETVFLMGEAITRQKVLELLIEAVPGDRFLMSITENFPVGKSVGNLLTISEVLKKYGKYPLSMRLLKKGSRSKDDKSNLGAIFSR